VGVTKYSLLKSTIVCSLFEAENSFRAALFPSFEAREPDYTTLIESLKAVGKVTSRFLNGTG